MVSYWDGCSTHETTLTYGYDQVKFSPCDPTERISSSLTPLIYYSYDYVRILLTTTPDVRKDTLSRKATLLCLKVAFLVQIFLQDKDTGTSL